MLPEVGTVALYKLITFLCNAVSFQALHYFRSLYSLCHRHHLIDVLLLHSPASISHRKEPHFFLRFWNPFIHIVCVP
jgi:hypothetical protein